MQSALARHVLSSMLTQLGLILDPATSGVDSIFNDSMSHRMSLELTSVWANNGDTISLSYAHTSALKGDFVRTGKRDLSGMVCLEEIIFRKGDPLKITASRRRQLFVTDVLWSGLRLLGSGGDLLHARPSQSWRVQRVPRHTAKQ